MRQGIAHLRAAWAAHPDDPELNDLIAEFRSCDEDFERLWAEPGDGATGRGRKVMRHPVAGVLTLDFEVLTPFQDPDQQLLIFRAADQEAQAALDRLRAG